MEAAMAAAAIATSVGIAAHFLDLPSRIDEAKTIANYATQPLSVALTKYDEPNNHLFHTLLVWAAHQVGGWHRVVFRLPAFLSFCLFLPALWWFVRLEYGARAAAFTIALVAPAPSFIGHATNARGYTLWLLLFVTALLCGRALVRSPDKKLLWVGWATAVALGCYTIPVAVFSAAMTAAWMLLVRRRVRGGDDFRPFALRTAAWSAVAVGAVAAFYLPAVLAEGASGLTEMLRITAPGSEMTLLQVATHPARWWYRWHSTVPAPAWVQGALLGLLAVGATVRGRSCGRKGTLLWAMGVGWVLMLAAFPLLKHSRHALWVLLVCRIMAGAGLALVLSRMLGRARVRWPSVATARRTRLLERVVLAVVFCSVLWWTIQPLPVTTVRSREALPIMVSAVVGLMRPGDYFGACRPSLRLPLLVSEVHAVEAVQGGGADLPAASHQPPSAHRVSAPGARIDAASTSSAPGSGRPTGRLFLFDPTRGEGPCSGVSPLAGDLPETGRPYHQLVTLSGLGVHGTSTGRVYMLPDWAPGTTRPAPPHE